MNILGRDNPHWILLQRRAMKSSSLFTTTALPRPFCPAQIVIWSIDWFPNSLFKTLAFFLCFLIGTEMFF